MDKKALEKRPYAVSSECPPIISDNNSNTYLRSDGKQFFGKLS